MDEFNLRENVFDVCVPFLWNRCYMQDYGLDFGKTKEELRFLNSVLQGTSVRQIPIVCRDVIRALVCNYYYVGCNTRTRLAQGICRESCVEYVEDGDCAESIAWLANFAVTSGNAFVFTPNCSDPLWYVKTQRTMEDVTLDVEQCIDMSGKCKNVANTVTTRTAIMNVHDFKYALSIIIFQML